MPGPSILDNCNFFDISNFSLTELSNDLNANQRISFPKYDYDNDNKKMNFIFKTNLIKITAYGIPPLNQNYYPTDKHRNFIKIPHDPTQTSCNELFALLGKIDTYMTTAETKQTLFGNNAHKYRYNPLIKTPHQQEDEDGNVVGYQKFNYCKVNFCTDHNTGNLKTSAFRKKNNGDVQLFENMKTVSDLNEYLRWSSTARFAITINKMWANKKPIGSQSIDYGLTLKCLQTVIIEPEPVYNNQYFEKNFIFDDDFDDGETGIIEVEEEQESEPKIFSSQFKNNKYIKNKKLQQGKKEYNIDI